MIMQSRGERLLAAGQALGLSLDHETIERLLAFVELLQRWNATYNLTSVRDPDQMLAQHVIDCLAVSGPLQREVPAGGRRILDVGSGGGLPGVILAMIRPGDQVTCIDAVGKKAAFIRQAAVDLKLPNLAAQHARVEQWRSVPFDVASSRAFASLADLVRLSRHLVARGGVWMAMKGKRPDQEITALPADVEMFHVEPLQIPDLAAQRCLIWMRPRA